MNDCFRLLLVTVVLCLGAACGTARTTRPTSPTAQPLTPASVLVASEATTKTTNAPPSGRQFQKWNPLWWFGNAEDPEPPDWYRPGSSHRRWLWQLRNPLHNFTFYVIGIADRPFTRSGTYPGAVFAPDGGWNWAVARYRWVRLPFVSYNGKWGRGYFGWRERGNFGAKVNFGKLPPPTPPALPEP